MEKKKTACGCPGPLCGDMSYGEIRAKMSEVFITREQSENDLDRIHAKWRRIAAQL